MLWGWCALHFTGIFCLKSKRVNASVNIACLWMFSYMFGFDWRGFSQLSRIKCIFHSAATAVWCSCFFPLALFRFFFFISQPKRKTHTLEYKRIAKHVYWIFNGIQIGIDTWNEFRRFTTSIFQFGFVYPVLCHECRTVKYQKKKKIKIKQRCEKQCEGKTNKVDTHKMKSCECSCSIVTSNTQQAKVPHWIQSELCVNSFGCCLFSWYNCKSV